MRIWDINPGYLNRQSLLGEHRELHGIVAITTQRKKGYARHPETLRWSGFGWALKQRHRLLAAEMALRGFTDRSPVLTRSRKDQWPAVYIDASHRQFQLLAVKYKDKEPGRIPLPDSPQALWRQHKYSVLARNLDLYTSIGRQVARTKPSADISNLADQLTELLRVRPSVGGSRNALQHMWGHVNTAADKGCNVESWSPMKLLQAIQQRTQEGKASYLFQSTALSELRAWI
jgi:hypothetical protein